MTLNVVEDPAVLRHENQAGNVEKQPSGRRGSLERVPSGRRGSLEKQPSNRRGTLQAQTPEALAARAQWQHWEQGQATGRKTSFTFDPLALTFIISSWNFDWEGVDFGTRPLCFDHGALTPVTGVFTPSPQGDGLDVWTAASPDALAAFSNELRVGV